MISTEQFVDAVATRLGDGRASAQVDGDSLYWITLAGIGPWRVVVVDDDDVDQHFACVWWPTGDHDVPESRTVTDDPAMVRRLADAARAAAEGG